MTESTPLKTRKTPLKDTRLPLHDICNCKPKKTKNKKNKKIKNIIGIGSGIEFYLHSVCTCSLDSTKVCICGTGQDKSVHNVHLTDHCAIFFALPSLWPSSRQSFCASSLLFSSLLFPFLTFVTDSLHCIASLKI